MPTLSAFDFIDNLEAQIQASRKLLDQARDFPWVDEENLSALERAVDDFENNVMDVSVNDLTMSRINQLNDISADIHQRTTALGRSLIQNA